MIFSQVGKGFVGSALNKSFALKEFNIKVYDKFQNIGSPEDILDSDYIFFCLPTPFMPNLGYDLSAIEENLLLLNKNNFTGSVILKSTVLPGTCRMLQEKYNINIIHNPEFLTERTAFEDFHNQQHIVLGLNYPFISDDLYLKSYNIFDFYKKYYPESTISICKTEESESMKIFCNTFYAVKIQIFNEFYLLSKKLDIDFDKVKDLMLKNGWINKMHTNVPGPDGKLSYGGHCFPKDTSALLEQMSALDVPREVLSGCISERNTMRDDK